MSLATALCAYCEQLSENAPSHAVRVMRCPLCKTELGVTAGGAKFRLQSGETPHPHSHRHAILISAVVAALLLGALIVALVMFVRARTPEAPPTPNVAAVIAPTLHSTESAVSEIAPDAVAPTQTTRQPEGAIAKPYSRPWRFRPAGKASPLPNKTIAALPETLPIIVLRDYPLSFNGNLASYETTIGALRRAPEVALLEPVPKSTSKEEGAQRVKDMMSRIREATGKHQNSEAFPGKLIEKRAGLGGLPFLSDKACRLPTEAARQLEMASTLFRVTVDCSARATASRVDPQIIDVFWRQWMGYGEGARGVAVSRSISAREETALNTSSASAEHEAVGVAALTQILAAEDAAVRRSLVKKLAAVNHKSVTRALVKLAVFDLDKDVRGLAIEGLKYRSADEYLSQLLDAFRYPWPPAAAHATDALIRLDSKMAVPRLIEFLGEPDPAAPFAVERRGKPAVMVRELVRINHHRNCQLCHAPADGSDGHQVPGLVPNPAEPLPSLSRVYDRASRDRDMIVRADTTYLRQDFSVLLATDEPGHWPDRQRYDFLVRTRTLNEQEAKVQGIGAKAETRSPQHDAALAALRELTGQDFGATAAAWRHARLSVPGIFGTSKPGYTQ